MWERKYKPWKHKHYSRGREDNKTMRRTVQIKVWKNSLVLGLKLPNPSTTALIWDIPSVLQYSYKPYYYNRLSIIIFFLLSMVSVKQLFQHLWDSAIPILLIRNCVTERQEQTDVSKAGNWEQISHNYSNKSNHHYRLAPNPISLPSFKIFPTAYVMKFRLFWHLFSPNLLLIMSSSKFLARCQDDKAKCNSVKEPETERSRGQYCEASKILGILKALKLNTIIKQCQVSFFQCNLVSIYMGYHFSHEDNSSVPLGAG